MPGVSGFAARVLHHIIFFSPGTFCQLREGCPVHKRAWRPPGTFSPGTFMYRPIAAHPPRSWLPLTYLCIFKLDTALPSDCIAERLHCRATALPSDCIAERLHCRTTTLLKRSGPRGVWPGGPGGGRRARGAPDPPPGPPAKHPAAAPRCSHSSDTTRFLGS